MLFNPLVSCDNPFEIIFQYYTRFVRERERERERESGVHSYQHRGTGRYRGEISSFGTRNLGRKRALFVRERGDPTKEGGFRDSKIARLKIYGRRGKRKEEREREREKRRRKGKETAPFFRPLGSARTGSFIGT